MTPDDKVLVEVQATMSVRRDTHRAILRKLTDVVWGFVFYVWVLLGAVGGDAYLIAAIGGLALLVVATAATVQGEVSRIGWASLITQLTRIMKQSDDAGYGA